VPAGGAGGRAGLGAALAGRRGQRGEQPSAGTSGTLAIASNAAPASVSLTGTGTAATGDTVLLQIDDSTFERAVGLSTGGTIYFVNRLTPPRYPATLRSVSIYFDNAADALPPGYVISVLSGANPQGTANINGVALMTTAAAAGAADRFETFAVPPITISSGDFVVGFVVNNPVGLFPMSYDTTAPAQRRSYVSPDGGGFPAARIVGGRHARGLRDSRNGRSDPIASAIGKRNRTREGAGPQANACGSVCSSPFHAWAPDYGCMGIRCDEISHPWYAGFGALGRRRVRGKDCVHLILFEHFVVAMNSFLPERADTGRNGCR
jgi:hypothetical protein